MRAFEVASSGNSGGWRSTRPSWGAYLPTDDKVDQARATLDRSTPGTLVDGSFVDQAMTGAAELTVELASRYGTRRASVVDP